MSPVKLLGSMCVTRPVKRHRGPELVSKRSGMFASKRTDSPTNTGCLVLKKIPRTEMSIDFAACLLPVEFYRAKYQRHTQFESMGIPSSKMDDMGPILSEGVNTGRDCY
jgi:hypothetical protein